MRRGRRAVGAGRSHDKVDLGEDPTRTQEELEKDGCARERT